MSAPHRDHSRPLRVGFAGTGYIADWHAKALALLAGVELAAVCDRSLPRAKSFARGHGLDDSRAFASVDAMLAGVKLDAVHVLTTPDAHAAVARAAIDAGVATLVEKPMCPTAAECRELADLAESKGVSLAVGHNFLFSPVYEQLRADLSAGKLGRIDHVAITWHKELPQAKAGPFDAWMLRDPRHIMLEVGSHGVAHLLDLLGEIDASSLRSRASNPATLPSGVPFYRRWQVDAERGLAAARLEFSFGPGFAEHTIHVRGAVGSATVDFERNTYVLRRHTAAGDDLDRFRMVHGESASLHGQAGRNLLHYVLSKAKLSRRGSAYGSSIAGCLRAFYDRRVDDARCSPRRASEVIGLCERIGQLAVPAFEPKPPAPPLPPNQPTILVLGATGFIGSVLVRRLLGAGKRVRVLVRSPGRLPEEIRNRVDIVQGDLSEPADLDRALAGITHVCHLARANVTRWADYEEQDVRPTRLIAEKCLEHKVGRLIYTGTIDSYYTGRRAGTITESTPLDPRIHRRNFYARSKAAGEAILLDLHRTRGLPVVILRPGIVLGRGGTAFHWGVGMWPRDFICQIWGRGDNPLPLVLVDDVASAIVAALDAPGIEGESFNLVGPPAITARQYVQELERAGRTKLEARPTSIVRFFATDVLKWVAKCLVRHPDRHRRPSYRDWESRTQRATFDCTKAVRRLGWTPTRDRDEIIRRGIHEPVNDALS